MLDSTTSPAVVNSPAAHLSCDFYTDRPDGTEWMVAFVGKAPASDREAFDGPTAEAVHGLLAGIVDDLEIIDPDGCDSTDVEVVEPLRGRDCAIHIRSAYASISCVVLGMVLKRLMVAGYAVRHVEYWPDMPREVIDARDQLWLQENAGSAVAV